MSFDKSAIDRAIQYGQKNKHKEMFVNVNGEIFTSQNLAMLSVGNDASRIETVTVPAVRSSPKDSNENTIPAKPLTKAQQKKLNEEEAAKSAASEGEKDQGESQE